MPKYLNSPETRAYCKGALLFGLHEARDQLAGSAIPVIVEGPFDAIAVTTVGLRRYAGLAPCGTALTSSQVAALATVSDLVRVGVLMALDGDRAGHGGIVKAYEVLLRTPARPWLRSCPNNKTRLSSCRAAGLRRCALSLTAMNCLPRRSSTPIWTVGGVGSITQRAASPRCVPQPSSSHGRCHPRPQVIRQITGGQKIETLDENLRHVPNPSCR